MRNTRFVGCVVGFGDDSSVPRYQKAVETVCVPKSTSPARSAESMPWSSGVDVCQPFVGQIGAVAS